MSAVDAAYRALIHHSPGCPDCRSLRDEDGRSTGQCETADALLTAYQRAQREARNEARDKETK
nr:hypothetical protein [Streptomyces capitiformicae]